MSSASLWGLRRLSFCADLQVVDEHQLLVGPVLKIFMIMKCDAA
jgi:hypothetical protein